MRSKYGCPAWALLQKKTSRRVVPGGKGNGWSCASLELVLRPEHQDEPDEPEEEVQPEERQDAAEHADHELLSHEAHDHRDQAAHDAKDREDHEDHDDPREHPEHAHVEAPAEAARSIYERVSGKGARHLPEADEECEEVHDSCNDWFR